jgi:hypothetical protein
MKTLGGAAAALLLVCAAPAAGAGDPGKEQIRLNAADQAAARAAVVHRADLGSSTGWRGGPIKPDLSPPTTCAKFHPKQSDLVLTGVAETQFKHVGLQIDSEAQVLQTAQMVRLDWQRTVKAPAAVRCLRTKLTKALGSHAVLQSFREFAVPRIATFSTGFRAIVSVQANGASVQVMDEIILVGRGRTEITLSAVSPLAARGAVSAANLRLARILASRARA